MIKVIKNGNVITMDEKRIEKIEKLDIVIKDDVIYELTDDYSGHYDTIIDATNKYIIPGLINSHTHLGMSIFSGTSDSLELNDWLNNKIWDIEEKMTSEDIYNTTLLSCFQMIKTGTTTCADHYFESLRSINAIKETKIRSLFTNFLMDIDNSGRERFDIFKELYTKNKNNSELITFSLAPHSLYTCSEKYLLEIKEYAIKYSLPIHIHFSENLDEVKNITKKYGMKPVFFLDKLGFLDTKLILAHGTFIDDDELELLEKKKENISIVHNPISNLNLGCGIAPISKYISKGLNVCLGTDGAGSGLNIDMFYHMSIVDLLQKGLYQNPNILNSYDVLKLATINGAKALNIDNIVGSIEISKKADLVILDFNNIATYPVVNPISHIVHNTKPDNVFATIINGEILMNNNQLALNINENVLKEKIDKIINKLF